MTVVFADITIRRLRIEDAAIIAGALQALGWDRDVDEYQEYARQDAAGARTCFVAESGSEFVGYSMPWKPKPPSGARGWASVWGCTRTTEQLSGSMCDGATSRTGRGIMYDYKPIEYGTTGRIDDDATLILVRSF